MVENAIKFEPAKPFLRWAGGKKWLTKEIISIIPKNFNNYFEPFLGGGSIFFYLKSNSKLKHEAFLSDFNSELITTYETIRSKPLDLIKRLSAYTNTEQEYYKTRTEIPNNNVDLAARFIYLNKTSYNGLYRVNKKGEYNVPYGHRIIKNLFDYENLNRVSAILDEQVKLNSWDFEEIKSKISKGDLIFIDPPYTVAHENNGFVQYNQSIFTWEDQTRLSKLLEFISNKDAFFIMTNAKHDSIEELFSKYGESSIYERHSTIGGKGAQRQNIHEFIFKNF